MLDHAEPIVRWKVRYEPGAETTEVLLPHAWRQDMPANFEGPVEYETTIKIPRGQSTLHFHRVSYAADVLVGDELVYQHRGLWDGFLVPMDAYKGKVVTVRVLVTKNGGPTYPVNEVASGFLPYVFHSFGGMYGTVELHAGRVNLEPPAPAPRVQVRGSQLYVDGQPFYIRGLLHWGWFPELGHTNPPDLTIREEVQAAKAHGFNLVKFGLWVPPHRYLNILREEGMEAWLELPVWKPADDPATRNRIAEEIERIVRQYRRHDNIIAWTVGCELGPSVPYEFRAELAQRVQNLTGCPLVKDVSGGAEMYGGDLREKGTFYDFHPYSDITFLPLVLDSLARGPRQEAPLLLGESNDADVHRDISRIGDEMPFWASALSELNPRGVRWQYDLPEVVATNRFATHPTRFRHTALMESSRRQSLFMRKSYAEAIRSRSEIGGHVMTAWRDNPISSSGLFDDWGEARYSSAECATWNDEACIFMIPARRPPWLSGGNRPGWIDSLNLFEGPVVWRLGVHSEIEVSGGINWRLFTEKGEQVASGAEPFAHCPALVATQVAEIYLELKPGSYRLRAEFAGFENEWPVWVVPAASPLAATLDDPLLLFDGLPLTEGPRVLSSVFNSAAGIHFLTGEGTRPAPFWREAAYEFLRDEFWGQVPFANRWSRLLPVCPDRVLNKEWLRSRIGDFEVLLNRVDTRTYEDDPLLVRCAHGLITTLRPFGGLGIQPTSVDVNPAGFELLRRLLETL